MSSPGLTPAPDVSALLPYFASPGIIPPSARVDPTLKFVEPDPPTRLLFVWECGVLIVRKWLELVVDLLSHMIYGPRKKSWGIGMTMMNTLARDTSRHSHLLDIKFVRRVVSLSALLPIPSDVLVTPATFKVRKRKLRGILQECDALEGGERELTGEWVVERRLWHKLRQRSAAGSEKPSDGRRNTEGIILLVHGGAYVMFNAITHRPIAIPLSRGANARVFSVNYRLAPETIFPGQLHDVVSSYFHLVDDLHFSPSNIIVAGDSAGGSLCLALMMYLRDHDYPLPGAAILMSPWVDLTMSCESWDTNAEYDVPTKPIQGCPLDPVTCYLGEHLEEYLTHPYASPLFGRFTGLPPMLIQAGGAELLRDEIALLAYKASLAGVEVKHESYEDAVHVFQTYPNLDAARRAFLSCHEFVKHLFPEWQAGSPGALGSQTEREMEEEIDNHDGDGVKGSFEEAAENGWVGGSSQGGSSSGPSSWQDVHSGWFRLQGESMPSPLLSSPPTSEDEGPAPPDTPSHVPRSPTNNQTKQDRHHF